MRGEGRGRPVERQALEGPQHPAGIQEQLLPAGTAGRVVPPVKPNVAVVVRRRALAQLACLSHHLANDSSVPHSECQKNRLHGMQRDRGFRILKKLTRGVF